MSLLTYLSFFLLQTASPNWQTYKSTETVDVFYRAEQCHDEANGIHREYILLKFVNKTTKKMTLSWQLESYADNVCTTCNKSEYKYTLELEPQASKEGNCSSGDHALKIFVKHLDLPNAKAFTKFELGDLSVTVLSHVAPRF